MTLIYMTTVRDLSRGTPLNAAKFLFYRPPVWLISELQKLELVFKSIPFLSVLFFLITRSFQLVSQARIILK